MADGCDPWSALAGSWRKPLEQGVSVARKTRRRSPWRKSGVAPRLAMRPDGKARRARIPGVFERGATQPGGMQRRSNADGVAPRAVQAGDAFFRPAENGVRRELPRAQGEGRGRRRME